MNNSNSFSRWQPEYAARGISLFPVMLEGKNKRPAIRNYMKIGDRGSRKLACGGYANSEAFGFAAGERSRITVLDVDSANENDLADAMSRHGQSKFVVKSVSGHYQAYYRWSGETRRIRPVSGRPVDILGGGFTVAAPSQSNDGRGYQIIAGTLDDLATLPPLKGGGVGSVAALDQMGEGSGRNETLFRLLGKQAHSCDDLASLLDVAASVNSEFGVPLSDKEVERTARSVWKMQVEGRNRFGQYGAWFEASDLSKYLTVLSPQAFALLAFVKANNGPASQFIVADAMRDRSEFASWSRRDFTKARRELIERGLIVPLTRKAPGQAVKFAMGELGREGSGEVFVEDMIPIPVGVARIDNRPRSQSDGLANFKAAGSVVDSIMTKVRAA